MAYTGSKFAETEGLGVVQIAKLMRAEFKAVELPPGVTLSVVSDHNSIGVTVHGMTDAQVWLPQDDDDRANFRRAEHTPAAAALLAKLKTIYNAYQRDDSDAQVDHFDVHYYGRVTFASDADAAFAATMKTQAAARKAALAAEKAAAAAAPLLARMTEDGIGVYDKKTSRRVALVKLRPYELRNITQAQVNYALHCALFDVVRYDRITRTYAITRRTV